MKPFTQIENQLEKWRTEDRLERKYTLPVINFASIEPFILESGFLENYKPRMVHSVYFDSPSNTCFQDASRGSRSRFKVRWRWYEQNGKISPSHLELKIKSADVVRKYIILNKKTENIRENIRAENFPRPCEQIFSGWKPVLSNSYLRAYYQHSYLPIRVTLDKNLTPSMEETISSKLKFNSKYILEIKYPIDAEPLLQELKFLKVLPLQRQRFSKFTEGINSISGMILSSFH
ncbi:VTC domain-containing protein [Patescibacteria group bacterium]|nr:VTC domain-containing protein [Patescibacteria group bacterium]